MKQHGRFLALGLGAVALFAVGCGTGPDTRPDTGTTPTDGGGESDEGPGPGPIVDVSTILDPPKEGLGFQLKTDKFEVPAGKKPEDLRKQSKIKVGTLDATYLDVSGTYLKKFPPFDPNAKTTKVENYRELYVVFETKDGLASIVLLGPAKTIDKHKAAFDTWVKNFK